MVVTLLLNFIFQLRNMCRSIWTLMDWWCCCGWTGRREEFHHPLGRSQKNKNKRATTVTTITTSGITMGWPTNSAGTAAGQSQQLVAQQRLLLLLALELFRDGRQRQSWISHGRVVREAVDDWTATRLSLQPVSAPFLFFESFLFFSLAVYSRRPLNWIESTCKWS